MEVECLTQVFFILTNSNEICNSFYLFLHLNLDYLYFDSTLFYVTDALSQLLKHNFKTNFYWEEIKQNAKQKHLLFRFRTNKNALQIWIPSPMHFKQDFAKYGIQMIMKVILTFQEC